MCSQGITPGSGLELSSSKCSIWRCALDHLESQASGVTGIPRRAQTPSLRDVRHVVLWRKMCMLLNACLLSCDCCLLADRWCSRSCGPCIPPAHSPRRSRQKGSAFFNRQRCVPPCAAYASCMLSLLSCTACSPFKVALHAWTLDAHGDWCSHAPLTPSAQGLFSGAAHAYPS